MVVVPVIANASLSVTAPPDVTERFPVVVQAPRATVLPETRVIFLDPRVSPSEVIAPEVRVDAEVPAPSDPAVVACPMVSVPVVVIKSSSVSVNSALVAVPKASAWLVTD